MMMISSSTPPPMYMVTSLGVAGHPDNGRPPGTVTGVISHLILAGGKSSPGARRPAPLTTRKDGRLMRFSLYSELQLHPGKTAEQLYAEVLEQIENADRLGFDVYAVIEHYFFPKFSVSTNPTALFAAAAQRTRNIRFRTMLHALPYHNPTVLASVIHATDILTG